MTPFWCVGSCVATPPRHAARTTFPCGIGTAGHGRKLAQLPSSFEWFSAITNGARSTAVTPASARPLSCIAFLAEEAFAEQPTFRSRSIVEFSSAARDQVEPDCTGHRRVVNGPSPSGGL